MNIRNGVATSLVIKMSGGNKSIGEVNFRHWSKHCLCLVCIQCCLFNIFYDIEHQTTLEKEWIRIMINVCCVLKDNFRWIKWYPCCRLRFMNVPTLDCSKHPKIKWILISSWRPIVWNKIEEPHLVQMLKLNWTIVASKWNSECL